MVPMTIFLCSKTWLRMYFSSTRAQVSADTEVQAGMDNLTGAWWNIGIPKCAKRQKWAGQPRKCYPLQSNLSLLTTSTLFCRKPSVFQIKSQLASTLCRALRNYLALTSALILSPHLPNQPSRPLRKGTCLIHLCSAWALPRVLAGKIIKGKGGRNSFYIRWPPVPTQEKKSQN